MLPRHLTESVTGHYLVNRYFNVSNGVHDLSLDLAMCKSGCYIDDQCMNHVMYADDICLLACYWPATNVRCVS